MWCLCKSRARDWMEDGRGIVLERHEYDEYWRKKDFIGFERSLTFNHRQSIGPSISY